MSEKIKSFATRVRLAVVLTQPFQGNVSSDASSLSNDKNNFKSLKDFNFWNVLYVGTAFRDGVFCNCRAAIYASASLTVYLALIIVQFVLPPDDDRMGEPA